MRERIFIDEEQLRSRGRDPRQDGAGQRWPGPRLGAHHHQQADLQVLLDSRSIIKNPFEQKYRGIKTTNNTIKSKIMALKFADELLTTLGFVRQNDEMFQLEDEQFGNFAEGEPAIEYRRRLSNARLTSQAEYEHELSLIKLHREQRAEQARKDEETRKLKESLKNDQKERVHMKVDESKSKQLKFGTKQTTYKDIGVDLCGSKKPGQGGG